MASIWPIGGGKGGSGKTFVTASLGMLLAREGFRTLLVDVDLGAANLHTLLGVPHPERSLSDFINRRVVSLEETVVPVTGNLFFISGAMSNLDVANLAFEQKNRLLRHILKLPYEFILLDLGAGTAFNTIDFFMISNTCIFITTPEPTAIENIYRLIRAVYFRKAKSILKHHLFRSLTRESEEKNERNAATNPQLLLHFIKESDPAKGAELEKALHALEFRLIVNQQRRQDNPHLGRLMGKVIEKHLHLRMLPIGNIAFDERVHGSVCKKTPFIDLYPYTQTALDLRSCCLQLLSAGRPAEAPQAAVQ
jgi:flagellar biosynthesis protein FlhG